MNFLEYIKSAQGSSSEDSFGYSALRPDTETRNIICTEMAKIGLDFIDPTYIHSTLMYDLSNPIKAQDLLKINKPGSLYKDISNLRLDILGNAVVIIFDSESILARCEELSEFMTHSFDDHILHVSLVYVDKNDHRFEDTLNDLLEQIENSSLLGVLNSHLDSGGLYFSQEYFEKIK